MHVQKMTFLLSNTTPAGGVYQEGTRIARARSCWGRQKYKPSRLLFLRARGAGGSASLTHNLLKMLILPETIFAQTFVGDKATHAETNGVVMVPDVQSIRSLVSGFRGCFHATWINPPT